MAGLDARRVALIKSKIEATSSKVGTGYFVTDELVLTASHVVPDDATDIRVRVEAGESKWREAEQKVAWRDERLDVALIRVRQKLDLAGEEVVWGDDIPEKDTPWNSVAFPSAAYKAQENEWKSSGLSGTLYAFGGGGQGTRELDLGVSYSPEQPEGWQGISGAPVFVGEKLLGIIKTVSKDFKGQRLTGVPSVELFNNPAFRLAIAKPWLEELPKNQWVLVLRSVSDGSHLVETIKTVITKHNLALTEHGTESQLEPQPVIVNADQILQSPESWLQFVRALSKASIMVVDVTDFGPGAMLALGVRAVARRGVTIASTARKLDETELSSLPFNIQETKLLCHGKHFSIKDPRHPVATIGSALRDGLAELLKNPRYLDLPVYDAVRCSVYKTPSGTPTARNSILVLCPFNKKYSDNWNNISNFLINQFAESNIARMVDISSPRLVGQVLYEYIRWSTTCVVDWTYWRPNVFFEIGVRMACSDIGPISLIEDFEVTTIEDSKEENICQKKQLVDLLKPTQYKLPKSDDSGNETDKGNLDEMLNQATDAHLAIRNGMPQPMALSVLPHDATYRVVRESFDWTQDRLTLKPNEFLQKIIETQFSDDPQKLGNSPVLFSQNAEYARELRIGAAEYWFATWYYYKNRFQSEFETNPDKKKELTNLAETIQQWIKNARGDHFDRLRKELDEITNDLGC